MTALANSPIITFRQATMNLRSACAASGPTLPTATIMAAVHSYRQSLDQFVPMGFPSSVLQRVDSLIEDLGALGQTGYLARQSILTFHADLKKIPLFPSVGDSDSDVHAMIQHHVKSAERHASRMRESAIRTISALPAGSFLIGHPEDGDQYLYVSDYLPHAGRPLFAGDTDGPDIVISQEPISDIDPSLVDPHSFRLLTQEEVYGGDGGRPSLTAISPYKLEAILGKGGCSVVYLAEDMRMRRPVAIKVIRKDLSEAKFKENIDALQNELSLQPYLNDDCVVRFFTTGIAQNGAHYVVMEYVKYTLEDFLMEFLWADYDQALAEKLAMQMIRCVAKLHQRGVLHLDLKNENYFVTEDWDVKIGDFGLSAHVSKPPKQTPGFFSGTPGYAAPERIAAVAELPFSTQEDIFPLAACLYAMVTTKEAFYTGSPMEAMMRTLNHHPEPPSVIAPRRPISPHLERAIMRGLQKDPSKRYANATEMLMDAFPR